MSLCDWSGHVLLDSTVLPDSNAATSMNEVCGADRSFRNPFFFSRFCVLVHALVCFLLQWKEARNRKMCCNVPYFAKLFLRFFLSFFRSVFKQRGSCGERPMEKPLNAQRHAIQIVFCFILWFNNAPKWHTEKQMFCLVCAGNSNSYCFSYSSQHIFYSFVK